MTTALDALTQFANWPDLTEGRPSCGTGRALRSSTAEIAHFHSDGQADLHLTARMIRRFEADLKNSTAVRLVPDSQWVTMRLESQADIHLLMTLVSVALRAHQERPESVDSPHVPCNDHGYAFPAPWPAGN